MFRKLIEAICFRLINGPLNGGQTVFHISRLDLRPGDVLVARFKDRLSPPAAARVRDMLSEKVKGHTILVLENGADLAVLTAAEIEVRSKPSALAA